MGSFTSEALVGLSKSNVKSLIKSTKTRMVNGSAPLLPNFLASLSDGVAGPSVHVAVAEQKLFDIAADNYGR